MRVLPAIARLLQGRNIKSTINPAVHQHTLAGRDGCNGSPYCNQTTNGTVWTTDCGIERPSTEGFLKDQDELIKFFAGFFNEFIERFNNKTLEDNEHTIPLFMAKHLAPDVSHSALACDGRSKCQISSCKDLGQKLTQRERQFAWYIFEFFSNLDHAQRAMYDGTGSFFAILDMELPKFVRTFSYADEQQTIAQMREQHKKMILALIMSMALLISAAVAGMPLAPMIGHVTVTAGQIASRFASSAHSVATISSIVRPVLAWSKNIPKHKPALDPWAGLINNGYISLQNLAVTVDPVTDINGYDNLIQDFLHTLAEMQRNALRALSEDNYNLMTGGTTRNKLSLLSLFAMGQYQVPDIGMTARISALMTTYYSATTMNVLWQREGTYIVETQAPDGKTCVQDDRGHNRNRVCLHERSNMTYWLYSVWLDDGKFITSPPGFSKLEGDIGYKGIRLEDVVRSSLWKEEIWDGMQHTNGTHDPVDIMTMLTSSLPEIDHYPSLEGGNSTLGNNTTSGLLLKPLEDYGRVPGTITLPICRSWSGFAISAVNIKKSANAPCICDDLDSRSWNWNKPDDGSFNGTNRFVKHTKLYNNKKWGRMCQKEHKCEEKGRWRDRLKLPKSEDSVVEDAWTRCEKTFDHDEKGTQKE